MVAFGMYFEAAAPIGVTIGGDRKRGIKADFLFFFLHDQLGCIVVSFTESKERWGTEEAGGGLQA